MENNMKSIWEEIEDVQNYIFNYQINEAFSKLSIIIDDLNQLAILKDDKTVDEVNQIFNEINDAIVNKDYLFVADLLEYRLKKVMKSGLS